MEPTICPESGERSDFVLDSRPIWRMVYLYTDEKEEKEGQASDPFDANQSSRSDADYAAMAEAGVPLAGRVCGAVD